jgi:large subunit ribosomal protein L30
MRWFVLNKLRITLIRSYIGRPESQRKILAGMGLGKLNRSVLLEDTPEIKGMVRKVRHLVSMEEVKGDKI